MRAARPGDLRALRGRERRFVPRLGPGGEQNGGHRDALGALGGGGNLSHAQQGYRPIAGTIRIVPPATVTSESPNRSTVASSPRPWSAASIWEAVGQLGGAE